MKGDGTINVLDLSKLLSLASAIESLPSMIDSTRALQREIAALREDLKSNRSQSPKRFYNLKQAAEALNTSETSIRRYLERGLLRRSLAQGKIQIPASDIENFGARTI